MGLTVVILAAGQGKRMCSDLPKVLQPLANKPLLAHVIDAAKALNPSQIVIVYGHSAELVKKTIADESLIWVMQDKQLGTGHAVQTALDKVTKGNQVLVLCGDAPLIHEKTLKSLYQATDAKALGMITANLAHPESYGRIIRDKHESVVGIVEAKDATPEQLLITEINAGIYLVSETHLQKWLPALKSNNAQSEYYLTDIIQMAVKDHVKIVTTQPSNSAEIMGANNKGQLACLERAYQSLQAKTLLDQGATLLDPQRLDVRGSVSIGRDVTIDVNVILEGEVTLGNRCHIGPNCVLKNVTLADDVVVHAFSHLEEAKVDSKSQIGPYARLRPGSELKSGAKIGNFVEIKKSTIGEKSKVNHLSYIGDAELGQSVNIGAGVITCNYDGVRKFKTTIGDNVFVGTDSQLVAPVEIEAGAYIGAGSTITKTAPKDKLTLSRSKQITIDHWQKPVKSDGE